MPAQPQDHKPKKGQPFKFTGADGKSHTLPNATAGRKKMSGRDYRDAIMDGEVGQSVLMFKILDACDADADALDALYDMPGDDMMDVLKAWGEHGDGDGASLGE